MIPDTTTDTSMDMLLVSVAVASNQRLVSLEVTLRREGQEAWFTVSCPCGWEQGAVIVSLDDEAIWLATGLIEAIERLASPGHHLKTA